MTCFIEQPYNQQPMYVGQVAQSGQQIMPPPQPPIPQQQQQPIVGQVPQPNRNGPIYVPSNVSKVNQAAAVAQQQQQPQVMNTIPNSQPGIYPGQQPQQIANNGYGQTNGGYGNPQQYVAQIVS